MTGGRAHQHQTPIPAWLLPQPLGWRARFGGIGLATLAFLAVILTLFDPGLTIDEPINCGHGKRMVYVLFHHPLSYLDGATVYRLWERGHEHPPLCRFLIGLGHALLDPAPDDPAAMVPTLGRWISALAFAGVVYLVFALGYEGSGWVGGLGGGLAVALFPRLFAHAHFASPEMISAAFILLALRMAAAAFRGPEPPGKWAVALAGLYLGLALLTKLTAVLLVPAVAAAMLLRWRLRGFSWFVLWAAVGGVVFVVGWPWLWPFSFPGYPPGVLGTVARLREYLNVGLERAVIYVWYFGKAYPEGTTKVPWHFVWVFFATTIPLGFLIVGAALGLPALCKRERPRDAVFVLSLLGVTLLAFSLPVERYDGERLFLFAFPLWGVVVGYGFGAAMRYVAAWGPGALSRVRLSAAVLAVVGVVAAPGVGLVRLHPYPLSYYNCLIGGLPGATRRGLEPTYWGDTVAQPLLEAFAATADPEANAYLLPTLYAGHAVYLTSPTMRAKRQFVRPGDLLEADRGRWVLMFPRLAYLTDPLSLRIQREGRVAFEISREGVWLSRLYELPADFFASAPK